MAWHAELQARLEAKRPREAAWKRAQRARRRPAGQVSSTEVYPDDTLRASLLAAAKSNVVLDGDVSPILDLLEQGCDLDLDVLPTIARRVQRDSRRGARLSSLTFGHHELAQTRHSERG